MLLWMHLLPVVIFSLNVYLHGWSQRQVHSNIFNFKIKTQRLKTVKGYPYSYSSNLMGYKKIKDVLV